MRISGWRIAGNIPNVPKYVLIVAPHTSNWDFFHGFCAFLVLRLDNTWLAKHTVFFWPLGILARAFGGMPIDRSKGGNIVRACVAEFARREQDVHHHHARRNARQGEGVEARLLLHRHGSERSDRSRGARLREAARADHGAVHPTGDAAADLPKIKAMYSARMARHPENF